MKKKALLLLALLLPMAAFAYDFQLVVSSGQTLYFDIVPGGVAVVRPNANAGYTGAWNGYDKPTGALVIPSSVTWQGNVYQVLSVEPAAFYGCNYLTSVVIEHGVTSLAASAFCYCSSIDSVVVPASVASIGSQAFGGCTSLSTVRILAATPPTTASGAFYNVTLSSCVLYVPCHSDSVYAAAVPWNGFGSIVPMPCSASVSTSVNNPSRGHVTGAGTYLYGTQVTLTALPFDGFAFICWNDGDTLNPRLIQATSDTSFVAMFFPLVHDTLELHFHDTTFVHDTTVLYDTIDLSPQYFQLRVLSASSNLGLGVGSATLPEGTVVEICALPLEGSRFAAWDDGSVANPRQVTVDGNRTLTALFERVGASSPQASVWNVAVEGNSLAVSCPMGCHVTLYDAAGRILSSTIASQPSILFNNLPSGVYVVSVDNLPARKVVVD